MTRQKRAKLGSAGFRVGTAQEFLGLSDDVARLIDLKARRIQMLRSTRAAGRLRQQDLAALISSSQSRVAKMESGSPDVSLDLICRALFALGVSREQIGRTISGRRAA